MPRLKKSPKKSVNTRRQSSHLRTKQFRSAADFVEPVRELLMLRVSREIDRREWTQAQAAQFLGVTQPRISDLTRGQTEKFTIDVLVHWIGLLGMELKIDTKIGGKSQSMYAWLDASEAAIPYYTKLIAADPMCTESYWKRAYAYHQRGQYDLAIGDYTRAMELDATLQYLRINRAQSYVCLGQFSSAFLDYDQLIAQNPDSSTCASAYFNRGTLHEWMKSYQAAIKDFFTVLEIEPNNNQAQQHLDNIRKKAENKNDDE